MKVLVLGVVCASLLGGVAALPDTAQASTTIRGIPEVGATLTRSAGKGTWQMLNPKKKWVTLGTAPRLVVPFRALGTTIRVLNTATKRPGRAVGPVSPRIVGVPQVGVTLRVDPAIATTTWQRQRRGRWENVGSGITYTPDVARAGELLRVQLTFKKRTYPSRPSSPVLPAPTTGGGGNSGGGGSGGGSTPVAPSAPANTSLPVLVGAATIGTQLSVTNGRWSGTPTAYAYQWQRAPSGTASWGDIAGATQNTYVVSAEDGNHVLRAQVRASNAGGGTWASSLSSSAVPPARPELVFDGEFLVPLVTGTPRVGNQLSASTGSWSGSPTSYEYLWQVSNDGADGWVTATGVGNRTSAYTIAPADTDRFLRVQVIARNAGGSSDPAHSDTTEAILAALPVATSAPVVSGVVQVDKTLTTTTGAWTNSPIDYDYQWQVADSPTGPWDDALGIGAQSEAYAIDAADEGRYLRVSVVAVNSGGFSVLPSISEPRGPVLPRVPEVDEVPTISGRSNVAQVLSVSQGEWSGTGPFSYTYLWQVSNDGLGGWTTASGAAAGATYMVPSEYEGKFMRALVTAANAGGSSEPVDTDIIGPLLEAVPVIVSDPTISGTARVGETMTADEGSWAGAPSDFEFQWQVSPNGTDQWESATGAGASGSEYDVVPEDEGRFLRVVVVAINDGGESEPRASAASEQIRMAVPVVIALPSVTGDPVEGSLLTASPGLWDGAPTSWEYQWERSPDGVAWAPIVGAESDTYLVTLDDEGYFLRVVVVAMNDGGASAPEESPEFGPILVTP